MPKKNKGFHSWNCSGCTNKCYRIINGVVSEYCRQIVDYGGLNTVWIGNTVYCKNKTSDPKKTDRNVRIL